MLQAVLDKENAGIIIRGEFYDLDKLYFLNERLAGTYGVEPNCLLEGYENAASILKSLNYEIRHAERGDRELYQCYNGIRKYWFAPEGTPDRQIVKEEDKDDPMEIVNEIEDAITLDLDIDIEEFYEMDEEDQRDALYELNCDDEDIEVYLGWLNRDQTWFFLSEDYPEFSEMNTYLQFGIPFSVCLLYALVYRELLCQKADFMEKSLQQAKETEDGLRGYEIDFCRNRLPGELLLAEMLMTELFSCVYKAAGDENYEKIEKALPKPGFLAGMTEENIKEIERVVLNNTCLDVDSILLLIQNLSEIRKSTAPLQ